MQLLMFIVNDVDFVCQMM